MSVEAYKNNIIIRMTKTDGSWFHFGDVYTGLDAM